MVVKPPPKTTGQRLKAAREAIGMSQSELATATGLALDSIQNWERDRHQMREEAIRAICKELEITSDELLGIVKA